MEKLSGRSLDEDVIKSACQSVGVPTSREMGCKIPVFLCLLSHSVPIYFFGLGGFSFEQVVGWTGLPLST